MKYLALGLMFLASCATFSSHDKVFRHVADHTLKVSTDTGHGSGFCVKQQGGYSWILTCWHVVDDNPDGWFVIHMDTGLDSVEPNIFAIGKVVFYDRERDLALLKAKGEFPVFEILSNAEFNSMVFERGSQQVPEGTRVVVGGYMGGIYPAIATVGFVTKKNVFISETLGILHSAGTWYGASGGPIVHHPSGAVVGMCARIYCSMSDKSWAISAPVINDFLETWGE